MVYSVFNVLFFLSKCAYKLWSQCHDLIIDKPKRGSLPVVQSYSLLALFAPISQACKPQIYISQAALAEIVLFRFRQQEKCKIDFESVTEAEDIISSFSDCSTAGILMVFCTPGVVQWPLRVPLKIIQPLTCFRQLWASAAVTSSHRI